MDQVTIPNSPKTQAASHRERTNAKGVEVALLDELDRLVADRDKAEGDVGNLLGKFREAEAALNARRSEVLAIETRASQVRRAFEVLRAQGALDD